MYTCAMKYNIIRFDNSDGNYTGNPTVIATGVPKGRAIQWLANLRSTAVSERYIMVKSGNK